jgi:diguanylate cyclase (GGDEF)-like protein
MFARYGGEEFALILRGIDLAAAVATAEPVRLVTESCRFQYDEDVLTVTISVGVCQYDGGDQFEDGAQMIEAADKLLYLAKAAGRNCVQFTSSAS